jgi:hypothetical protein
MEEAFLFSGSHTLDFGHWMTEYLPKLAIALLAGPADRRSCTVHADQASRRKSRSR